MTFGPASYGAETKYLYLEIRPDKSLGVRARRRLVATFSKTGDWDAPKDGAFGADGLPLFRWRKPLLRLHPNDLEPESFPFLSDLVAAGLRGVGGKWRAAFAGRDCPDRCPCTHCRKEDEDLRCTSVGYYNSCPPLFTDEDWQEVPA